MREEFRQGGMVGPGHIAASEAAGDPIAVHEYEKAARFAKSRVFVMPSVARHRPKYFGWLPRLVWAKARQAASHLKLIGTAYRHRDLDLIVVKAFSTTMFAAVAPFLWHARARMLMTMHHNLQFAHRRPHERWLLRLLCRARFRFAVLYALDGVAELGIQPDHEQFFVLYPPIPNRSAISDGGRPLPRPVGIGVIGDFRTEKNSEEVLQLLVEARDRGDIGTRIVIGCRSIELLRRWRARGVEGINTTDYRDYLVALASCEVVVLNYGAARYYYRSSGVIADAVALGAAVVCPDFPVFRRQITEPVPVGAAFRDPADLVRAVHAALELRRSQPENCVIWARARTPQEFSRRLDEFIRAQRLCEVGSRNC